jgi:hypothetical protein
MGRLIATYNGKSAEHLNNGLTLVLGVSGKGSESRIRRFFSLLCRLFDVSLLRRRVAASLNGYSVFAVLPQWHVEGPIHRNSSDMGEPSDSSGKRSVRR